MSTKPPPLQFDTCYHIYSRGINRENVFFEERNYAYFLERYAHHLTHYFDTYAYCLLPNHFHFLVRVKAFEEIDACTVVMTTPSQKFANFLNAYAKAINKSYDRTGSLFQQRFPRKRVHSEAYFTHLIAYIHRNPQEHGIAEDFRDWPHTSYAELLSSDQTMLHRQQVLGWFAPEDPAAARDSFLGFHEQQPNGDVVSSLLIH